MQDRLIVKPSNQHWQRCFWWCWLVVFGLLIVGFSWNKWHRLAYSESVSITVPNSAHARLAPGSNESERKGKRIDEIHVGDRVFAECPTGQDDLCAGVELDPPTWRKIELRATKEDGSWADVVLLRPESWLMGRDAKEGGTVEVGVRECGINGPARVLSISRCPPIKPGKGCVVTGTFKHAAVNVVDLYLVEQTEPIGTTANHLFWSEDRQRFIRTDTLRVGERVRGIDRIASIGDAKPRTLPALVFNLEVAAAHVYHVGPLGILVHNGIADFPGLNPALSGKSYVYQLTNAGDVIYYGKADSFENLIERMNEHLKLKPLDKMQVIAQGLTPEQALTLETYMMTNKTGSVSKADIKPALLNEKVSIKNVDSSVLKAAQKGILAKPVTLCS
jgi:hypothetical protein